MSKKREKYISKIELKQRKKILIILKKIYKKDFENLDIKKHINENYIYRCRIGKSRIIFSINNNNKIKIIDIGPRGDIYK